MEKPKFTPGKWKWKADTNPRHIVGSGRDIARAYGQFDDDEADANASIIAAAPDLYQACLFALIAVRFVTSNTGDDQALANIAPECEAAEKVLRAALARAEGRAE